MFFLFSFFPFLLFLRKCFFYFFFILVFLSTMFHLQALTSNFNKRCFICSRCSMEMWCPDDVGQDSWDWVGPPTWERACFNPPECGGGCSCQIVLLLLLLFWTRAEVNRMCFSTNAVLLGMALNSGTTRRSAKNAEKPRKALHRHQNQLTRFNCELDCLQTPAMN